MLDHLIAYKIIIAFGIFANRELFSLGWSEKNFFFEIQAGYQLKLRVWTYKKDF